MFNLSDDQTSRDSLFGAVHSAYAAHLDRWKLLLDAYDGEGGFLTGDNLWKFPREFDHEHTRRKTMARYHNYAAPIVDLYTRKVCAKVQRETSDEGLQAWWQDVDGAGTSIDDFLRNALAKALAGGHVGILADKTPDPPAGPSVADENARVFLTTYLPQAIPDWRLQRDETLVAVKLFEQVESTDLLEAPDAASGPEQVLLWDRDEWVRVPKDADAPIVRANHNLGLVPLVILRPRRSQRWPLIGASILGDGNILRAIYNRASEEDQVLRDQAFSMFVVTVPPDSAKTLEDVKKEMGHDVGTTRALFVYGTADFKTADMKCAQTVRQNQQYLVREVYRIAHVRFEHDSRDAEAAESVRLQNQELSDVLSGVSAELQRVDLELAKLYYAWTSASPEQALARFEAAGITLTYPTDFFDEEPMAKVETLGAAMKAVPVAAFEAEVQKRIVDEMLPDLDAQARDDIFKAIDAGEGHRDPLADALKLKAATMAQQGFRQPAMLAEEAA